MVFYAYTEIVVGVKVLSFIQIITVPVLILGEETYLKHFPRRHPEVGAGFLVFRI